MNAANRLEFIVGTTASGKSDLAMARAMATGAVILSCDSLCVYQHMDIGTAKPTAADRAAVPHFGIDLCPPHQQFSVAGYIAYRDSVLQKLEQAGNPVLVVGGSGFYLKSFFAPVVDSLPIPDDLVTTVNQLKASCGADASGAAAYLDRLVEELRRINPAPGDLAGLDLQNPVRVEKALLRCLASGKTYAQLRRDFEQLVPPLPQWHKHVTLVERPPEEMDQRNERRVDAMLEAGLVDEVVQLRAVGFEANHSAANAIGYREILDYLDGRCSLAQARHRIITHTRQLMRRQRTWFRHQIPIITPLGK